MVALQPRMTKLLLLLLVVLLLLLEQGMALPGSGHSSDRMTAAKIAMLPAAVAVAEGVWTFRSCRDNSSER